MPTPSHRRLATIALAAIASLSSVPLTLAAETNAASVAMGARATVVAGEGAKLDTKTGPDALIDNNVHSRMVVSGAPYTVTLELFQPLPVTRIAFSCSDYPTELAAKDIEITLDDGTVIKHTLEKKLPEKRKPAWQSIDINKTTRSIKIQVLSTTEQEGKVNWGGIGEIAVYTNEDVSAKFKVPGHDPNQPVSVNIPSMTADQKPVAVKLPPQAKPNVWPRTMHLPEELAEMRTKVQASEASKKAYDALIGNAEAALKKEVVFPDPKGPLSQAKSRGDDVMKAHSQLSKDAGNLGRAYAYTNDKKYADKAAEILVGYAKIYEQYPEHKGANAADTGKISAQRLSEAMWLIPQLIAYDLIHDTLSAEDQKLVETGLIRPCVEFIWRKTPAQQVAERDKANPDWRKTTPPAPAKRTPIGNWMNFYNTATMLAGAVMQDKDYIDIAAANFRVLVRNGIGEDGMWGEGAIGYHYFAMAAMAPGFETAARHGYDLWGFDDNRFKLLFDSPRMYAYPDGTMPGINDSSRVKGAGYQMLVMDYAYHRYGDDRYAGVINETNRQLHFSEGIYAPSIVLEKLPEPATVQYPSTVFSGLGYAIVRNNDIYALMDYGQHGGVHGHYDKLNLILFANGDEMGGEPKFYPYENALHGQWTTETIAHNTMTIDEKSHIAKEGKLLAYEGTTPVKVMRAEVAGAYPGALQDRTLVLVDGQLIDVFSARSTYERTFDRTLRYVGKLDQLKGEATTVLGARDGYQHIKVAGRTPADGGWTGIWSSEKGPLTISVASQPAQEVIVGTDVDAAQLAIVRQKGLRADVGVVYVPGKTTPVPAKMLDTGSADVVAMQVENPDKSQTLVLISHKPGTWKALGIESDASVLYLKRTGDTVTEALYTGGTFAKAGGAELKTEATGNAYGQAEGGTLKQSLSWTAAK